MSDMNTTQRHHIESQIFPEDLLEELILISKVTGVPGYRPKVFSSLFTGLPKWSLPALIEARRISREIAEDHIKIVKNSQGSSVKKYNQTDKNRCEEVVEDSYDSCDESLYLECTALMMWFPGSSIANHVDDGPGLYLKNRHVSGVVWLNSSSNADDKQSTIDDKEAPDGQGQQENGNEKRRKIDINSCDIIIDEEKQRNRNQHLDGKNTRCKFQTDSNKDEEVIEKSMTYGLINVDQKFSGGDFFINNSRHDVDYLKTIAADVQIQYLKIPPIRNTGCFFPSFFEHGVEEIKKGVRISLLLWFTKKRECCEDFKINIPTTSAIIEKDPYQQEDQLQEICGYGPHAQVGFQIPGFEKSSVDFAMRMKIAEQAFADFEAKTKSLRINCSWTSEINKFHIISENEKSELSIQSCKEIPLQTRFANFRQKREILFERLYRCKMELGQELA